MTWLDAIAEAMQTARSAFWFVVLCALFAGAVWFGWKAWSGVIGQ